ncbi:MAG TPA: TlpA disulfide reductase family protein [Ohtaekwangia sp.]|uniref:TlpA family protein disulfide reductase n=1 Tax=Ohtaekwangia sp. TaxID=2066019 RepID=UPI002F932588
MRKKIFLFFLLFSLYRLSAQQATVVKFDRLQQLMNEKSGTIQIINFWATWCAPCVKELPLFEKLRSESTDVKVTLINLDFADKVKKVNTFLLKKNIQSEVLLLDEIDYNTWIDKVDKSWGGAIPATLIINPKNGKRKFVERELHEGELQKLIEEVQ